MGDDYVPSKRQTFLYFAYGSNLWTNRIRIQNKSAIRSGIAELKGYRLDFYKPEDRKSYWNGCSATVTEDENKSVWGALWEIDLMDMAMLDAQEGVHVGFYIPLIKEVYRPDGEVVECRFYQMCDAPTDIVKLGSDSLPDDRKPSKTYLNVIINGGLESQLPDKYVSFLKSIVHNGRVAEPEILAQVFPEELDAENAV